MWRARSGWMTIGLSTLVLFGCGDGTPPLDELPLRDTLRAEPAVVAALDDSARQRLAARFEAAASEDATSDAVAASPTPRGEVMLLDETRLRRAVDALVVGTIGDGVARPSGEGVGDETPLPPLEGEVATSTAGLEARGLSGSAGPRLRALLLVSGARRLERVVGWPTGAIAIGETVYVDASWLVALAPGETGDGGASDSPRPAGPAPAAVLDSARASSDATSNDLAPSTALVAPATSTVSSDGGVVIVVPPLNPPPPPPPPPPSGPSFWDACAAGSDTCAASSDGCDTSSDGSDSCSGGDGYDDSSSCSSGGDPSDDSCSAPPDDGSGCRTAPGRGHPRDAVIVWLLAPLGFLLGKRR
jgi:hypothetical protein